MERRASDRIKGWAQAKVKFSGAVSIAVALNISGTGLCIESPLEVAKKDKLEITLHAPDAIDPKLHTEVMWRSKIGSHISGLPNRIGLKVLQMENISKEDFSTFVGSFSDQSFELSRMSRIKVVVEERHEMRGLKIQSLFFGGCYLHLDKGMPKVGEILTIAIHIPTSNSPVKYEGKVIYIINDQRARALGVGIKKGFGVQFTKELAGKSAALVAYLGKNEPVFGKS